MQNTIQQVRARVEAAALRAHASFVPSAQGADGDTFTLDGVTYELDDDADVTAGNILVDITSNANLADDLDDLVTAIEANQGDAYKVTDNATDLLIVARHGRPFAIAGTGFSSIITIENNPVNPADDANVPAIASRAATAADVTQGSMVFAFGKTPVGLVVQVRTAAGIAKAYVGAAVIDGESVTLDNSGAVDFADTDVVTVIATF